MICERKRTGSNHYQHGEYFATLYQKDDVYKFGIGKKKGGMGACSNPYQTEDEADEEVRSWLTTLDEGSASLGDLQEHFKTQWHTSKNGNQTCCRDGLWYTIVEDRFGEGYRVREGSQMLPETYGDLDEAKDAIDERTEK